MACQTQTREIDGRTFTVTQFPARQGLKMKARLVRLVGPVLDALPSKAQVASDFSKIAQHINPDELVSFAVDMLAYTKMDKKELSEAVIDSEFAGEYVTLYKLLGFVIDANGFFGKGGIGSLLQRAREVGLPVISPTE